MEEMKGKRKGGKVMGENTVRPPKKFLIMALLMSVRLLDLNYKPSVTRVQLLDEFSCC